MEIIMSTVITATSSERLGFTPVAASIFLTIKPQITITRQVKIIFKNLFISYYADGCPGE
jgi:hypothetical protein